MKIIDISWPITENITEYKDRTTIKLTPVKSFLQDGVNETLITLHGHTGTHVDAPLHMLPDGNPIEKIELNKLIGECQVLDLTKVETKITKQDLLKYKIKENQIILLKTKNSYLEPTEQFNYNFVYLGLSGAEYLASKNIKAIGIDYLGIERNQPNHPVHKIFLKTNVPIIEGLRLKRADEQIYEFCCLPMLIPNLDSAPARAILIKKNK